MGHNVKLEVTIYVAKRDIEDKTVESVVANVLRKTLDHYIELESVKIITK